MPIPKLTILVIDDEPLSRKALAHFLESIGFNVITAADAVEAWSALENSNTNFSVILLDRILLDTPSNDLLQQIKESSALKHIPVIMMTGFASNTDAIAAVKAGVFDFVYKPIDFVMLKSLINRAITQVPLP